MTYKYLESSLSIKKIPKETFTNHFQQVLDADFKVASDWHTIKEETSRGSNNFEDIDVRVIKAIAMRTGGKLGDDHKILSFQDINHAAQLGTMYFFDENYWISVNTEEIKNLAASVTVRRCNNTLRWKNPYTGKVYTEECFIDYMIKETRDYSTAGSSLVQPSGFIEVTCQKNDITTLIKQNQRFLFGNKSNWISYKVQGGGLNNYNNLKTMDNESTGLIKLSMQVVQENSQLDDLINGVADALENIYTIALDYSVLNMNIGDAFTLTPTVKDNLKIVTPSLGWTTSKSSVATVDIYGKVTSVGSGKTTITATIDDNPEAYASCSVTVSATPVSNTKVVILPNVNYVYEGETKIFTCYLYTDDVVQGDTFTFEIDGDVPPSYYKFAVLNDNSFSIKNINRYMTDTLTVTATSGSHVQILSILLRGGW